MNIVKKILKYFDKLEDRVRAALSRRPLVYALIGGIGVVLFWRGVWMTADEFSFMTGPISMLAGVLILMLIGLWVSVFVGDSIIISGLKKEHKEFEKARIEIEKESRNIEVLEGEVKKIEKKLMQRKRKTPR